ncbi:TP901 family phage tail tape measure protein [Microvirga flocculans]|uniref:TP901 family phage tail tape measure protein n=1 Tax=Microvirga flocculans TaxID=217168 RepID=A0A7W6N9T0_9HYPH|nr:phage tail tape measure protein [Microvirga flocculans]MBB4042001.1 TP901 family phage tail tape measure protein [Microvirga flocculans]
MANLTSQLTVRLKDGVSGPAGKAARSIRDLDRTARNARGGTRQLAASTRTLAVAGSALDGAGLGLSAAGGAIGVAAFAAGAALHKAGREALSFERSMYRVEKATDTTGAAAKKFEDDILRISKQTGMAKEDVADIMASAGFAGRPVKELARFTEYAAKATSAWEMSADEVGQGLAEIGNIYAANQTRIEEIGDAINTAADSSASKESDLLEFLRRTGAAGKQVGITAEQTLAVGAALKEVGVTTEVAATGYNALLTLMQLGEGFSKDAGAGLKALGVNSTKMRREFTAKPMEATLGLLTKISKVSDPLKRAEILTNLFGKEYQDDISRLINQLPRVNTLLQTMGDKKNYVGSVQKGFELWQEKDFAKIERAEKAWDSLMTRLGRPIKLGLGDAAENLSRFLNDLENGDTLLQRILKRLKAYEEEKNGSEGAGKGTLEVVQDAVTGHVIPNLPYVAPAIAGYKALDAWAGATGEEARLKGQTAAIAEKMERERKAKATLDDARSRRAAGPLTPSEQRRIDLEIGRAEDELRAAQRDADAVRAKLAELAGSVAQLERQVRSGESVMNFGRSPPPDTVAPTLGGGASFGFGPGGAPEGSQSGLDRITGKAAEAAQVLQALTNPVAPTVDISSIERARAAVRGLLSDLSQIGPAMQNAGNSAGSLSFGQEFQNRRSGSYADYD